MKVYHVEVVQEEGWFIGRILDRPGVTTQGKSLDELVFMLRDAVTLMWDEKNVHLELALGPKISFTSSKQAKARKLRPIVAA
jgi:predicted RNase H-like HicB family nuclease